MERYFGIDFSGNYQMWDPRCNRCNVWIAEVERNQGRLNLVNLFHVQQLVGAGHPFDRLAALLKAGNFEAAAIDAPFSVPKVFIQDGYLAFLRRIGSIADPENRHFLKADKFVTAVSGIPPPLNPSKPLRITESYWLGKGLNVRSTLWAGARGGAAMTAACLSLLYRAERPIWPWVQESKGLIVEAFPMAQLKLWGLPYSGYGKQDGGGKLARQKILDGIQGRIGLGGYEDIIALNPDALDSVICVFAGVAVKTTRVAVPPDDSASLEGWISVYV